MTGLNEYDLFPYSNPELVLDTAGMQIEQPGESNDSIRFGDAIIDIRMEQLARNDMKFDFLNNPVLTSSHFDGVLRSQAADDTEAIRLATSSFATPEVGILFLPTPSQFDTGVLLPQPADKPETTPYLPANSSLEIPEWGNLFYSNNILHFSGGEPTSSATSLPIIDSRLDGRAASLSHLEPAERDNSFDLNAIARRSSNREQTSRLTIMNCPITNLHVDGSSVAPDLSFQHFFDIQSTLVNRVQTLDIAKVGKEPMEAKANSSLVLCHSSVNATTSPALSNGLYGRAEDTQNIQSLSLVKKQYPHRPEN